MEWFLETIIKLKKNPNSWQGKFIEISSRIFEDLEANLVLSLSDLNPVSTVSCSFAQLECFIKCAIL